MKGIAKKNFRNGISSSKLQKICEVRILLYFQHLSDAWKEYYRHSETRDRRWGNFIGFVCHILRKFYGSDKVRVINP